MFAVLIGAVCASTAPSTVYGATAGVMSPAEVVEIDRDRDGALITVEGEAIGEHLRAVGGGRWVNILGDEVGLGVWVTDEMAERITNFGDYRHDGDIVRFTGVLNISCVEHDGEFDVHARSMEVISLGSPREPEVEPWKGVAGVAGIAVAAGLWMLYRRRRDQKQE
ncbi:MAG: hypothetical protein U1E29_14700 [Coriobacteriia bacterium]|nr:hypothetical protein [Coriobacteriia bacterium]